MKPTSILSFVSLLLISSCSSQYDEMVVSMEEKNEVVQYYLQAEKVLDADPKKAEKLAAAALGVAQKSSYTQGMGDAYFMLGLAHEVQGQYGPSVAHHLKGLECHQKVGNRYGMIDSYNNLGRVYLMLELYEEAQVYFEKGLEMATQVQSKDDQAKLHYNLGRLQEEQKSYTKAQQEYTRAVTLYQELNSRTYIGYVYNDLAALVELKSQPDYNQILMYYEKSLKINQEMGFQAGIGWSFANMGRIHVKLKQPEQALSYLTTAEELLKNDFANLILVYVAKAKAYVMIKDHLSAQKSIRQIEALEGQLKGIQKKNLLYFYQVAQDIYTFSTPTLVAYYQRKEKQLQKELDSIKEKGIANQYKSQAAVRKAESDFKSVNLSDEQRLNLYLKIAIGLIVLFLGIIIYQYQNKRRILRDYRKFMRKYEPAFAMFEDK